MVSVGRITIRVSFSVSVRDNVMFRINFRLRLRDRC